MSTETLRLPTMPRYVRDVLDWIEHEETEFAKTSAIHWLYRPVHPKEWQGNELASLFVTFPECPGCRSCARYALVVFSPDYSERLRAYTRHIREPNTVMPGMDLLLSCTNQEEWNIALTLLEPTTNTCSGGAF